jgi:hypothetical protein
MRLAAFIAQKGIRSAACEDIPVDVARDYAELADFYGLPVAAARRRIALGNRPYVARIGGKVAAAGWVARRWAHLPAVGRSFRLPGEERFIWNLGADPGYDHGLLYAVLLRGIVLREDAVRFWLDPSTPTEPSLPDLDSTGFTEVGEVSFLAGAGAVLRANGPIELVLAAADLMGLRLAASHSSGVLCPKLTDFAESGPRATAAASRRHAAAFSQVEGT